MKAFQGPWAGIWNKAGHSWRPLQWVRMISFKSHVGMVIWGQSNDVQRHVQRIFLTITVYKDVNIFFPSKEIPSGAPGLLSSPKTFSSVETNPSAPCMVTRLGNSWNQVRAIFSQKWGKTTKQTQLFSVAACHWFWRQFWGGGRRAFKIIWAMAALL